MRDTRTLINWRKLTGATIRIYQKTNSRKENFFRGRMKGRETKIRVK